jgi:ribosomal protein S20
LTVGRSLYLDNTKITSIPKSAKIEGKIYGLKKESIMKKSELKEIIREYILEIKNKPDFEEELKKAYQAYLDTKGKELEEYFSNQVVKLLDLYKSKTGKDHPLSKKVDMIAENKLSYDELKKRKNKIEKSELKQLIKECLKEVDPASGGPVDVNLDETTDIDFETNWDKSSISELLDSVGQDKIKYYSSVKGISLGDWGTVKFSCDFGNHEVLYLEFEDEKLAKQALNSFSHALSNPYEFSSRFDKMPRIIMVRITD